MFDTKRAAWFAALAVVTACSGAGAGSTGPDETTTREPTTMLVPKLAAGGLPTGGDPVELDPADFGAPIDNPYWPMRPGTRWVYRESDPEGPELVVEVTVTDEVKAILGIEATVVHDVVTQGDEVVEDTYDWYAQDAAGNIWYLGEATEEYENGRVVSSEGSWEAGVDGAQPGVIVPGSPEVGMAYRQEYLEGEAEDAAEIVSLHERVDVPFGSFDDVLMTKDFTPLEPRILEHKFYARGVGPVLAIGVSGGSGREELVTFEPGPT
jgi:hypothetical protein